MIEVMELGEGPEVLVPPTLDAAEPVAGSGAGGRWMSRLLRWLFLDNPDQEAVRLVI